jgi:hypothetical protein
MKRRLCAAIRREWRGWALALAVPVLYVIGCILVGI